jgi:hypothetical protein
MYAICCTRFTNKTWEQNIIWKRHHNHVGCIYNSPMKIKEKVPLMIVMFMIEMNNDLNQIMGIGMLKNCVHTDKYYKIYEDGNYNRYTYKSSYRIDRYEFEKTDNMKYIEILETLIFKGSYHIKRSQGITQLPDWILNNKHIDFINIFKQMFIKKYKEGSEQSE